jgi:hypothetical protein
MACQKRVLTLGVLPVSRSLRDFKGSFDVQRQESAHFGIWRSSFSGHSSNSRIHLGPAAARLELSPVACLHLCSVVHVHADANGSRQALAGLSARGMPDDLPVKVPRRGVFTIGKALQAWPNTRFALMGPKLNEEMRSKSREIRHARSARLAPSASAAHRILM